MRLNKKAISVIIILVGLATIVVMSGLNFLIPQNTQTDVDNYVDTGGYKNMNKIFLNTKDNVKISADLYEIENPIGWLILIHMMPATKESWRDLAEEMLNNGYGSLAIDLRGHGESDGGPDSYLNENFNHQKSILDLEAGVDYLIQEKGATPDKISFIGASIGANLSLQYIVEHPEYKTAILFSPGLNYRGIKTEPLVKNLKPGQKVFFVSSRDDPNAENNVEENQKLFDLTPAGIENKIQPYDIGGHGTAILEKNPELKNLILDFLK